MAVSLRFLLSAVIAMVTIITASIAFGPMYAAGVVGVRSALGDLRRAYVGRTQNQTQSFLDVPREILETLRVQTARGLLDFDLSKYSAEYYAYLFDVTTGNTKLLNFMSFLQPSGGAWNSFRFINVDTRLMKLGSTPLAGWFNGTDLIVTEFNWQGQVTSTLRRIFAIDEALVMAMTPLGAIIANPNMKIRWRAAAAGYDGPQIAAMVQLLDPAGKFVGAAEMALLSWNFGNFLQGLGLRPRGRAVSVDAQTGIILGLSTDEPVAFLHASYLDLRAPDWMRMTLKTLYNLSDPLINQALDEVGRTAIVSEPAPFDRIVQTEYGRTYVDVLETTGPGLQLRTVLIMPELDFLEDVYKTQRQTIGGIAAAIVAMIVLAFVLGHVLTQPFLRLRDRMYLTASLQDDSAEDPPSLLTEVRGMQESYAMMRGELDKMKSYLPQSVLTALSRARDGTDDEPDDDEGEVGSMSAGTPKVGDLHIASSGDSELGQSIEQRSNGHSSERGSTKSTRSHRGGTVQSGTGVALLNTSAGLTHRRVTVVWFNLRGFHQYCAGSTASEIAAAEARLVERVSQHVAENRGVVDLFQGDRLQASFNAVRTCIGHSKRAAVATLAVVRDFHRDGGGFRVTAGMSVSNCHVGNVGSSSMKRFCVLGAAVPQAAVLERMTRLFGVSVLCPSMMYHELSLELLLRGVGVVQLPGLTKPKMVCAVEGSKQLDGEEWMYQLKGGEDGDPFVLPTRFFAAVAEGDAAIATEVLAKLHDQLGAGAPADAASMVQRLASDPTQAPTSDVSRFYAQCFTAAS